MSGRTLVVLSVTFLLGCASPRAVPRCDVCPTGELCDSTTGTCVAAPAAQDGGCLSNAGCTSPTRLCAADGRCVACLGNADCAQGLCDMQSGRCVAGAVESCGAVTSFVDLGSGPMRLRGSTARALNDATLSCALAGATGADVLFGLSLAQRRRLTATVRAVDPASGFQPIVGVRTDCNEARSELACSFTTPGTDRATVVTELNAGSVFLWVDSETGVGGEFELELSLADAPSVDACGQPGVLRGQDVEATGATDGLSDDLESSCGGMGAADAVYTFTLDRPRRVRVEVIGSLGYRPLIAVRRRCTDKSSELACAPAATNTAVIELPSLEAGEYAVIVDGATAASRGQYRLRLTTREPVPAPNNDTCATAQPIVLASSSSISLQGDTSQAQNDAVGCDGTGPELIYAIDLAAPQKVRALVTPLAGSLLQPVLYLRREAACESSVIREQLFCVAGGQGGFPAVIDVPRLEVGKWFLFVDGKARTSGAFDLTVELSPPPTPPANDTCRAATVLPISQGPVFLPNETTAGASSNAHICVGLDPRANDVVYSFTLSARQSVAIDARSAPGSRLYPVVALKQPGPCELTAPTIGRCGFSDLQVPDRAVLIEPALDPGTYFLWVSGDVSTQGSFSLRVNTAPALVAPLNDGCGSTGFLVALNAGAVQVGDTRAANNSTDGRCGLPTGANGEFAGDVVFSLQVAASVPSISITVAPDAVDGVLMRPLVYVRGPINTCTTQGPNLGCQAAPDFGAPVTLTLSNVMPGTYSVWVDGAGLSAGAFSVTVR